MRCLERHIRGVRRDKWPDMEALERKFEAVERRLGLPPQRYWRVIASPHAVDTLIVEREWPSLAEMEQGLARAMGDEEWQDLSRQGQPITSSIVVELYQPGFGGDI